MEEMRHGVAAGTDDVFRASRVLPGQSQDGEFPGLGMGNDVRSARVRRAGVSATMMKWVHSAAAVASFLLRFLPMSLRGLRGALDLGVHVRMATISST